MKELLSLFRNRSQRTAFEGRSCPEDERDSVEERRAGRKRAVALADDRFRTDRPDRQALMEA